MWALALGFISIPLGIGRQNSPTLLTCGLQTRSHWPALLAARRVALGLTFASRPVLIGARRAIPDDCHSAPGWMVVFSGTSGFDHFFLLVY